MTDHGDISETLAPKSEQLDAIELRGLPPQTYTVERVEVKKGAEQPVKVFLRGLPRPWRPGVTMRRVLADCWGHKSAAWADRQVQLYCDEDVTYGKDRPGGIRILALSHIDKARDVVTLLSQGRTGTYHVEPLTDVPATKAQPSEPTDAQVGACTDTAALGAMWKASGPQMRAHIEARVAALKAEPEQGAMFPEGDQR